MARRKLSQLKEDLARSGILLVADPSPQHIQLVNDDGLTLMTIRKSCMFDKEGMFFEDDL